MKKRIFLIVLIAVLFLLAYNWSFSQRNINANPSTSIAKIIEKTVSKELLIENTTIGKSSYIPIRELFEKLGFSVKWIQQEKAVLLYKEDDFIKLKVDDNYFICNGELIKHKIMPVLKNNKFYVSLEFMDNVFKDFEYNESKNLLSFYTKDTLKILTSLPAVENNEKLDKLLSYSNQMYYDNRNDVLEMTMDKSRSNEKSKKQFISESKEAESNHSETNVQVKGVDEADIIKTDGSYIYTLSNNKIYIVKSDIEDFRVINTLDFNDYDPLEFYIKDNKLVTIGYFHGVNLEKTKEDKKYKVSSSFENSLKVLVYDISDKNSLSLLREIELDGYYLSSRLINNNFYLAANKDIHNGYDELRPYYKDSISDKRIFVDYENIRYFPESIYNNYLITLGVDLINLDSSNIDVNAYLGSGNNMYVSEDNMYISQDKYKYNIYNSKESVDDSITSNIYKFKLEKGRIIYSTKGEVPGNILNQFSMDEHRGNFRIATTKDQSWRSSESKSTSNIYILDKNLKLISKTKDLAPGERIYSVRFMGDKVYVVTFRQVDPFYVIDLKEPNNPKVLGYLKIPGYSNYLHPYDENHIIGIGMDTIDKNGGVINGGVKISMFDVTDYNKPLETDKLIIGGRGSYTDIGSDHKSLLFSKEKNILALPIYVANYDKNTYKHSFETQGAFIIGLDNNFKFNLRGNISHLENSEDYNNHVRRIIYIDDYLYTVSDGKIKVSDFDTLEGIKDLSLENVE
jgi:uncharacterized secreted protein with C-terminal beta-propeller domain